MAENIDKEGGATIFDALSSRLLNSVKQSHAPVDPPPAWADDYSPSSPAPETPQTLNTAPAPLPLNFDGTGAPVSSPHNLDYFYNAAASFYADSPSSSAPVAQPIGSGVGPTLGPSVPDASAGSMQDDMPPGYYESLQQDLDLADSSATSSATSPRNPRALAVPEDGTPLPARRRAVLSRRGASPAAVYREGPAEHPVALRVQHAGRAAPAPALAVSEISSASCGDRTSLGKLGDAYGLWWESGKDGGTPEAFFVCEGWSGFETEGAGIVRVKAPAKCPDGGYDDPRRSSRDLATVHFRGGMAPPQFVCDDARAHIRMDVIISALMTVMVVETRKASLVKEMGPPPAYDSLPQWDSKVAENGDEWERWVGDYLMMHGRLAQRRLRKEGERNIGNIINMPWKKEW
ncbi:hypothetical protein B0J13DRAFT_609378 [Dactylonectria estremocensis]|uniref:Uncharacterized protein n=1 Tax=Dactylonectria estremocensis TaxID=1079267 RepID=A0A9P9EIG7_9HYPO|nr:hypothetical protein B0J13DRAFT_609378 [Dactylonectria estremocensis]